MPSYTATIGEQLKKQRLGPTFVRRGKQLRCAPKPMAPALHIGVADGPILFPRQVEGDNRPTIPPHVLMERDERHAAALVRNLTQEAFGDPEPGRRWPDGRCAPA
jgi:hypothetical protein